MAIIITAARGSVQMLALQQSAPTTTSARIPSPTTSPRWRSRLVRQPAPADHAGERRPVDEGGDVLIAWAFTSLAETDVRAAPRHARTTAMTSQSTQISL
jgi:hypothetical protein